MSFEYRSTKDYFFTTLATPAAIGDVALTSVTSAGFADLPTDFSAGAAGKVMPLVLHNPALGQYEVVWVTGHSSGSNTVNVTRGREGTTSRAWDAGTLVESAPTSRDVLGATLSTTLPSDPNVGSRFVLTNLGRTVQRTKLAGWQADVGVALPSDIGPSLNGITPPADATMILRGGAANAAWNGSSAFAFSFASPFPNGISGIVLTSGSHLVRNVVRATVSTTGATVLAFDFQAQPITSGSIAIEYIAMGW